jgi:transposase
LGYPSWTAYVAGEFSNAQRGLDPQKRVDLVAKLAGLGMSTRAIAPVVGVGKSTLLAIFQRPKWDT